MRKPALILLAMMIPALLFGAKYMELKDALVKLMPKGAKVYQNTVALTADQAKELNTRFTYDYMAGEKIKFYVARDAQSNALCYVAVMSEVIDKYSAVHNLAVAFDAKKNFRQLIVMELTDSESYPTGKQTFQDQFTGKTNIEKLSIGAGIDAATGATDSSAAILQGVKKAAWILKNYYK